MSPIELLMRLARRARYLGHKQRAELEMDEEMRSHLEFEVADRVARGMDAMEARRSALADFGGIERFKEDARDARGVRTIEDVVQDTTYAMRVLRKSPAFTTAAILTVAIGVASTTAVFSAVNAILFRPPPVASPDELFTIAEVWKSGQKSFQTDMAQQLYRYTSYRELRDIATPVLTGLAGYRYGTVALRTESEARPLSSMAVTTNYFSVLGVRPALGTLFTDTVEHSGLAAAEVVISHDLWQSQFSGDAQIIGKMLFVDSRQVTIVGVAPRGFQGTIIGLVSDVWVPANDGNVTMFGRLRPGISPTKAAALLTTLARPLPLTDTDPLHKVVRVTLDPVAGPPAMARGAIVGFMGMLLLTATMVLLIVAANIAGMFLARAAQRRREIAVRLALGASPSRIVRQLLTESIALCVAGGVGGILLASWLVSLLPAMQLPIGVRTALDLHVDGRVLAASFGVALVAGVLAGLTPALQSARVDLISTLRGTQQGLPARVGRTRSAFVVGQLALSLVLLVTAGLFTRALQRAVNTETGLDDRDVQVATINLSAHGYDNERGQALYNEFMAKLRARPEIASAAFALWTPLSLSLSSEELRRADGNKELITYGLADEQYLRTAGIPLVAGRGFTEADTKSAPQVALVNGTLARRLWPGQSPIGQELAVNGTRRVIGVIRDGKYRNLDEAPASYAMIPLAQRYSPRVVLHFRARGDRAAATGAVRAELARLNPNIALERIGMLDDEINLYFLPQKFAAWCIGLFGVMGLALAVLGIYGVVAFYVVQRTHEFGVRMALGATRRDIISAVMRPGARVAALAVIVGAPIAVALAHLARSFLYGVGAADPVTLVGVASLLGAVSMIASYVPARRAAKVDPVVSLRAE